MAKVKPLCVTLRPYKNWGKEYGHLLYVPVPVARAVGKKDHNPVPYGLIPPHPKIVLLLRNHKYPIRLPRVAIEFPRVGGEAVRWMGMLTVWSNPPGLRLHLGKRTLRDPVPEKVGAHVMMIYDRKGLERAPFLVFMLPFQCLGDVMQSASLSTSDGGRSS